MVRNADNPFGPAGVCDACGRACCVLSQAGAPGEPGIRCYHSACGKGFFRHRAEWEFVRCAACRGTGFLCAECAGKGVIATRRPGYA
jgi:hypothetical protein